MGDLTRHGSRVDSVFDLLGRDENDVTAALGFALTRSPAFMSALLSHVAPPSAGNVDCDVSAALEVRGEVGRTDLEITHPSGVLIIEAKRGWAL